jgi:hypothetical protein
MPSTASAVNCRVCHRPLRALLSISLGVGPICVKKARAEAATLMNQLRDPRASSTANFYQQYGLSQAELTLLAERSTRTAYLERIRHGRSTRPTTQQVVVAEDSRTRRTQNEPLTVEWITDDDAIIHSSGSDRHYHTNGQVCNCHQYRFRVAAHPENHPNGCRHMQAYHDALDEVQAHPDQHSHGIPAPMRRGRAVQPAIPVSEGTTQHPEIINPAMEITTPTREIVRPGFASIDITDEEMREQVLASWRENRAWDGIRMMENQAAFDALMEESEEEWEYVTDGSILGGTGNTFGIELEMEFASEGSWDRVARDLFNEGLSEYSRRQSYHTQGQLWVPTRDGSLINGGLEIVSPILQDRPEDWAQLKRVLEIAKFHGARVNQRTGCHTNIGAGPQDSRTFSWQRLGRAVMAHEATLYRMGGADSELYRERGNAGKHRGTNYVRPMPYDMSIHASDSPERARQKFGTNHEAMLNTTHGNRIEFRTPNGTLDFRQVQANVVVANAMMHQAATITNEHPLADTTPRFSETHEHFRRFSIDALSSDNPIRQESEEKAFRRFLDYLGHSVNRKAAAWLWKRGSI